MAAPRLQAPDSGLGSTGNPILDSANAVNTDDIEGSSLTLENNRPSQPSPLKSSMTAADLDTAYPAGAVSGGTSSTTTTTTSDSSSGIKQDSTASTSAAQHAHENAPVENVLSAIGGAVVTAPLAALEAISHKVPDLVETVKAHVPHLPSSSTTGQGSTSTRSTSDIQAQASQQASSVLASAQKLAQQATEYAQQGVHQIVEKLPESVTSHLPAQITTLGTDQHKPMEHAATGQKAYEFTEPHTTANFEASGSLQASKNPAIVDAQSDLAVKAESGDL